jgi:hypothetical protein
VCAKKIFPHAECAPKKYAMHALKDVNKSLGMLSIRKKFFTHAEPVLKKYVFACSASTEVTCENYQNILCMLSVR